MEWDYIIVGAGSAGCVIAKRLSEAGTTILLVEQNARLALKLAHYGYVLESGHIRMQGAADVLRADTSIVQAYLGD